MALRAATRSAFAAKAAPASARRVARPAGRAALRVRAEGEQAPAPTPEPAAAPAPAPVPVAAKAVSFGDVMAFSGAAPEVTNGR
jgi:hypothetical protein